MGRGVSAPEAPDQPPASPRRLGKAWATQGPSLLPCAAHMIFVTRGKVVLCCFRVSGGKFCAPTGDSVCQLLTGAEAAAAPPSPCWGARLQPLSLRPRSDSGGGRLCSDILKRIGEAHAGSRLPPSW